MPRFGNGSDLARELGISRQAVHKAEKSGRISRTAGGKFDLDAAVIQYGLHTDPQQQRRALAQQGRGATTALPDALDAGDWRMRRERADAERAEIELHKLKGTLVTGATVKAAASRSSYAIAASLSSIPDRIAAECGETDAQRVKIRQTAQREVDRLRNEIADALEHGTQ